MRDADATRKRLLDAARQEFAINGIAGARVDRIAEASGSNKAQIYHYFDSKEGLFQAVFEAMVAGVVEEAPIEVGDLPGYAVKLAKGYEQHPDILRLATWNRLERSGEAPIPLSVTSIQNKLAAIEAAQAAGVVSKRFPPAILLLLVQHLAAMWAEMNAEFAAAAPPPDVATQRAVIAEAVRCLLVDETPTSKSKPKPARKRTSR